MKENRTVQGVITSNLDNYEQRIKAGYRQSVFIAELITEGYKITPTYFSYCLNKARKLAEPKPEKNLHNAASSIIASQDQVEKPKSAITPTKPKIPFVLKEIPDDEKY